MTRHLAAASALLLLAANAGAADFPKPAKAFLAAHCIGCHDAGNKKGGLDLEALSTRLDDPTVKAKWTLVYDRVERGEMPPKQKAVLAEEVRGFTESLGGFLSAHDLARQAAAGRVPWRRLNRIEYENTIHDLLAIDIPLTQMLPEDGTAHGFDNVSEGLRLSSSQIESYLAAADAALDVAIYFGPSPKLNHKKKLSYLDVPQIKQLLAKPTGSLQKDGSKSYQAFRALPDALVVFHNGPWETILRESSAEVTGLYRVRLSAYSHQAKGRPPVVAKVMVTNFLQNRFGAAFDLLPDEPRVMECTVRLLQGEMIWMSSTGCDVAADGTHVQDVGGEKYTGTGMAIQWIEVEGPLIESWPPPSMNRVFGDLPIEPVAKPKRRELSYEVISTQPLEDAERLIASFARRAFRRPVTQTETARYTRLAREALAEGATLESALRRAYKAILVAPEFIFLQENPGKLDDHALAARLSYFLWSTTPDPELSKLADQGKLSDPATLRAQTDRLLASPKSHAFIHNFCGQWLNLRAIDATTPDRQLYPEFDELLRDAMVGETESFFEELLRNNLGAANLIDSDFAMLNRRLAEHYHIPGVLGEQFRKVKLPPGSRRGGLLTQASILKVTANGTVSSPVVRGAWVMKRLLGRESQPPPADAGAIEPDTRGTTTIREQLEKHRRSMTCAACHKYMDPPGFALECYDVIGGWRDYYRSQGKGEPVIDPATKKHMGYRKGPLVDPTGELADGRKFANIDELKAILLTQEEAVARTLATNLVTYATGAGVTFADRQRVEAILRNAKPHSYGLHTLVHEVVQSPLFQSK
jgi:hypothetical protein